MPIKSKMYRVRCRHCNKVFTVPSIASPLPEHPVERSIKDKKTDFNVYLPCPGSRHAGIPIETVYE
jgi:hypothetical protein